MSNSSKDQNVKIENHIELCARSFRNALYSTQDAVARDEVRPQGLYQPLLDIEMRFRIFSGSIREAVEQTQEVLTDFPDIVVQLSDLLDSCSGALDECECRR
jgi:hypothetical protein